MSLNAALAALNRGFSVFPVAAGSAIFSNATVAVSGAPATPVVNAETTA